MKFRALTGLGLLLASGTAARAQEYVISTIAGGAPPPTPVAAVNANIGPTYAVATDAAGNVYFISDNCVFRLDQNGALTRVAGNSRVGYSGDGGPAIDAKLNYPLGMAVDGAGNLFIADNGNKTIRRVFSNGIITTVAGNGSSGYSGDGGPAINAQITLPRGIAVDSAGNLFIADTSNERIRTVTSLPSQS